MEKKWVRYASSLENLHSFLPSCGPIFAATFSLNIQFWFVFLFPKACLGTSSVNSNRWELALSLALDCQRMLWKTLLLLDFVPLSTLLFCPDLFPCLSMGRKERCFIQLLFSARLQLIFQESRKPLERLNEDNPRFGNAFEFQDRFVANGDKRP